MSENDTNGSSMVEENQNWESDRLEADDETFYIQTSDEYDQLFSRVQMTVVDDVNLKNTSCRIVGPSGCGKTTLARSLAFDVKIADALINEHNLPVWDMSMDEIALFHDIVVQGEEEGNQDKELCPNCDTESIYARKTKTPTYRCNNCDEEFEDPVVEEVSDNYLEQFEEVGEVESELKDRNLLTAGGDPTDNYPHSRAEAYRELYTVYDEPPFPSTPYFEVTMSHAKYAKDLIGHPHIGDDGTTFVKGKITNAVEASNDEATVLTLDEINRAPTSAKDELYDALDGRVKISMDEVGGVEIEGTPENLVIISTMNKGSGHHVEPLDFAEKRRLGSTYYVDFLGKQYADKEIDLIETLTPANEELASEMVRTANDIRKTAENKDTDLSYGVPTGTLLEWAREAYTNYLAGVDRPVVKAGTSSVAKAIYDHDEDEVTKVESIISKNMQGIQFFDTSGDDGDDSASASTETRYVCKDHNNQGCSWSAPESEAEVQAKKFLVCPECDGELDQIDPGE